MQGIVIIEKTVDSETILTESSVAFPNLAENIVVIAAVGAQAAITIEVSIVPLIPRK